MRRFGPLAWNTIAAISLLFLFLGLGISLRSSEFIVGTPSHWLGLSGDLGFDGGREGLYVEFGRSSRDKDDWHKLTQRDFPLGFVWDQEQTDVRIHGRPIDSWINFFVIPYWFVASSAAFIPALWIRAFFRGRTMRPSGLCFACGYDLRASTSRCPECGRVPQKKI